MDNPNATIFSNTLSFGLSDTCSDQINDLFTSVYFRPFGSDEFVDITDSNPLSFINNETANHSSTDGFAGCYTVRFTDDFGNLGPTSDTICVDACPLYILPNVFTPNGDGNNDLYFPLRKAFVDRIQFSVFNRWGNLVYETADPEINWNGFNLDGKEAETGTYTYRCDIFVGTQSGSQLINSLSGTIDLIR
nr:gliding motility-associated C-terminal domain-containing protein [Membranihabitans marinus]